MPRRVSKYCQFKDCSNNDLTAGNHLHSFPMDDKRCQAWVKASGNEKLDGITPAQLRNRSVRICSDHFQEWCFMNVHTRHRLVHNALPCSSKPVADCTESTSSALPFSGCPSSTPSSSGVVLSSVPSTSASSATLLQSNISASEVLDSSACSSNNDAADSSVITLQNSSSVLHELLLTPIPSKQSTSLSSEGTMDIDHKVSTVSAQNGCSTPKRLKCLTSSRKKFTPRKQKLASKVKKFRDNLRRCKLKYTRLRQKKSSPLSLEKTLSSQGVNEKLSSFIQRQVALSSSTKKGKRYTVEDKINAYKIYCKSKAAYNTLRQVLELPTPRTLQRFISTKLADTGVSKDMLQALEKVLEHKPEEEKMFALVLDEMSLKPCLVYDTIKDQVVGFEDYGENSRSSKVASNALVLMLRTLDSHRKLPLAFYFTHAVNGDKLKELVLKTIEELYKVGACVKVVICDQAGSNSRMFSLLKVSPETPFFLYQGEKVFCMFDPPHLLKNLRKALMKYLLQTSLGLISFQHIRKFYEIDQTLLVKNARSLTDAHVYAQGFNSMKVSLAAQVFSRSVAAGLNMCIISGLLDESANPTMRFVLKMDSLFDSLNGTTKFPVKGKTLLCSASTDSEHMNFWREMIDLISSWKFLPLEASTFKSRCPGPMNKKGWLLTISSIIQLTEEILMRRKYFMTRRCNQDCLENFFSCIRASGGNRCNPSAMEFSNAYKMNCINFACSKSKFSNCEPDGDKMMFHLLSPGSTVVPSNTKSGVSCINDDELPVNNDSVLDVDDFEEEWLQQSSFEAAGVLARNTISYISGYLSKKVIAVSKVNNCMTCYHQLVDVNKTMSEDNVYLHLKENEACLNGLIYPTQNMSKCVAAFLETAEHYFKENLHASNLLQSLRASLAKSPMLNFVKCTEHSVKLKENLVFFSSKLILKIHLREENRKIIKLKCDLKKLRSIKKS